MTVDARADLGAESRFAALAAILWPDDQAVRLVRGSDPPAGWVAVERYLVLPNLRQPRFLVPVPNRRTAVAALLRYGRLRPARTRLARAALGSALRVGIPGRVLGDHLTVAVRADLPAAARRRALLVEHLGNELGGQTLVAAIGVGRPDPNTKPTLQLFDLAGKPRGYAKIGWNDATRFLVQTEIGALQRLERAGLTMPSRPALRYAGTWGALAIAVTAPLPPSVRQHPATDRPDPTAIAAVAASGDLRSSPLGQSEFWRRVCAEAAAIAVASDLPSVERDAVARAVATLGARAGEVSMQFGAAHGDWVFWNLAYDEDRLFAWDWEHAMEEAPLGFDAVHFEFHREFTWYGRTAEHAEAVAAHATPPVLAALGVPRDQHRLVLELFLLETALRAERMRQRGAGRDEERAASLTRLLDRLTAPRS